MGSGKAFMHADGGVRGDIARWQEGQPTVCELFYADAGVLGAKSSKTGLNVAMRRP